MISPTNILKNFQLYGCTDISFLTFLIFRYSSEIVYITVLLVCNRENTYGPIFWYKAFYPFDVNIHTLIGTAMPDINRELHHGEAIFLQVLTEECCVMAFFLCSHRQVEEYEQPHDMICIKSVKSHIRTGKESFFVSPL